VQHTSDRCRIAASANPGKRLLMASAPLMLACVELFHPHPHDLFEVDLTRWMAVHYAQIVLFPLAAWSQAVLVEEQPGYAAAICQIAMFIFAIAYVAFDTSAGIVTGLLVRAAHLTNSPEIWRAPMLAIWTHPVMGGNSDGTPALAIIGTMAWLIGTLCCAVVVRRAGYSLRPIAFLIVSAFGLFVFRTHAWPGGPVTFGSLASAVALMQRENSRAGV
jgi:hypothetical protein